MNHVGEQVHVLWSIADLMRDTWCEVVYGVDT